MTSKVGFSWRVSLFVVIGLALGAGCSRATGPGEEDHDGAHAHEAGHSHDHGPHDGAVVVVGDHLAHLEVVHDCGTGKLTCYLLDGDMKNPVDADGPLKINLKTDGGVRQLTAEGANGGLSVFECTDPALAVHGLNGQFELAMGSEVHFMKIPDHHHGSPADAHEQEGEGGHHDGDGDHDDHDDAEEDHHHDDNHDHEKQG